MFDIVAVGELLIDFTPVCLQNNSRICFEQNPGGAPPNVLIMASRLGGKTAFIGKVGDDHFGTYLKDVLEQNNVDTRGLKISRNCNTTLAFVHLDNGERSFDFYRNPGADTLLEKEEVDFGLIDQCKILHFGSLSFTDEPSRSAVLNAVRYAKQKKKLISYDPNYRPALWPGRDEAVQGMKLGLEYADIIKLSNDEAYLLTGKKGIEQSGEYLLNMGISLILITLGEEGSYYYYKNGNGYVGTFSSDTVDSTGAGDAFFGTMLYLISQKDKKIEDLPRDEIENMIKFANAAGALCVRKTGGIPAMPKKEEIEGILVEQGK